MIPTIEQICEDLAAGRITIQQAIEWLNIHTQTAESELRDSFAIAALPAHMEAIYKAKIGIETWHEDAAALAYATADAMLVERAKP